MGRMLEIVTPLHKATKRDYLARMNDDKVHCMVKAKEYEFDYWDGDRRYGYGGYKFIDGRWKPVAQALIDIYGLKDGSSVQPCRQEQIHHGRGLPERARAIQSRMLGADRGIDPAYVGVDLALQQLRLYRRLRFHLFRIRFLACR